MTLADQVPDGWVVKRLSEVAHITAGGDVDPLTGSPVETDFHPHPVYANAIERSAIHSYSSVARNPAGAVTITARGTLGYAVYREKPFTAIGRLLVVWPNDRFDGRFLAQYLNARVSFAVESTGVPQLTGPQAGSYEVMLPTSLPEQQAIAAALSDADGVVAGLERVIAKKRLIKQGAMQDLLTARRRLPGFSGEWTETKLGQYGKTYGGLSGKSKQDFGVGTDSYIEFLDVINSTAISGGEFPKVRLSAGERQNKVQRNDLLFNGSSETPEEVGLCAAVIADLENTYLNSFCFGYRLFGSDQIDPIFMAALIRSGEGRERIKHLAQGATRYNLSKRALLELALKLPSYDEQKAIAAVLRDMDAEIQALESRLAKARAVKEGMMQNLLTGRVRLV